MGGLSWRGRMSGFPEFAGVGLEPGEGLGGVLGGNLQGWVFHFDFSGLLRVRWSAMVQ